MKDEEVIKYWRENLSLPENFNKEDIMNFWDLEGRSYSVKVDTVKQFCNENDIQILIETGTYNGDMIDAVIKDFKKIISIELDEKLYQAAKHKFVEFPHISILRGDSGELLSKILESIQEPCIFWLDAHYVPNTTNTARGDLDTPILQELDSIFDHSIKNHVILIDDARCFIGPNPLLDDYPTIQELENFVKDKRPELYFEVKEDIVCIYSKS